LQYVCPRFLFDENNAGCSGLRRERETFRKQSPQLIKYGSAVAISESGNAVAVGDDYEAGTSSGIDGDTAKTAQYAAGAVYLVLAV
jgi:hypothetical protein